MAPGRGILHSAILLASLAGITVVDAEAITEDKLPRYKFRHSSSNQHPSEWIAGPNGYLYQFHIGEQSWLAAREFCLAENADLVSITSKEQLDWILRHYAPIHPSFDERYVQIGLVSLGDSSPFSWVDGSSIDQSIIEWTTVPSQGTHCAHLKVNEKKVESIDCDAAGSTLHINRFVCQRSTTVHNEQQRSNNYIWRKLENLLNYFGFAGENGKPAPKRDEEDDYWQTVETLTDEEKKIFIETAKNLTAADEPERTTVAEVEGSGTAPEDKSISEANSASREEKVVDENLVKRDEGVEGSEKKEGQNEVEETLTVLKEGKEEVKADTAVLPQRKLKREEDDELNKPLPLRELLDTEEGSGSSITDNANIETVPEDADLLASPTPTNEADIDKMIERMETLLDNLGTEKKQIGPIIIEKATEAPSVATTLIPIGPIIIEKAKETVVSGGEKVEDAAKETLPEAESVEASKEKVDEKKNEVKKEEKKEEEKKEEEKKEEEKKEEEKKEEEKKEDKKDEKEDLSADEVVRLSAEVKEMLDDVAKQLDSIEESLMVEEKLLTNRLNL